MRLSTLLTLPAVFVLAQSAAIPFSRRAGLEPEAKILDGIAGDLEKGTIVESILVDVACGPDTSSPHTTDANIEETAASKHHCRWVAIKKAGERKKLPTPERTREQIWRDQYSLRFDEVERKKGAIEDKYWFGQIDAAAWNRELAKVDRGY
jgi:hypothetical protein